MQDPIAQSFPLFITVPIFGFMLIVILAHAARRDRYVNYLLLSCWARFSITNLHEYTLQPLIGGFSVIALSSFLIVAAGLWVLAPRALADRRLLPFYVLIWVSAVSAFVNQGWMGAVNVSLKWLFLMVFAVAAYRAVRANGPASLFRPLALAFVAPIALQWLSILYDVRAPNYEGVYSYIGGNLHQQSFAIMILTFLFVTCCSVWLTVPGAVFRLLIAAAGCGFANYRTAILAGALPWGVFLILVTMRRVAPRQRIVVASVLGACVLAAAAVISTGMQERFADIGMAVDKGAALMQPPDFFTFQEQRMFSGRPYLWSQYIESYSQGTVINYLLGYGPESWSQRFELYAHNTFISTLYELGILGVAALSALLLVSVGTAMRARGSQRWILLSFHFTFFILNIGTMPLWTLEGEILYALLLSQTWFQAELSRRPVSRVVGARLPLTLTASTQ